MKNKQRISSYVIPVEVTQDKYMLLHGYSGSIDVIEKDAWNNLKSGQLDKQSHAKDLIEYLTDRGHITRLTREEEVAYVMRLANALHKKDMLLYYYIKSISILLLHLQALENIYDSESILNPFDIQHI
jgi:uncharacterized protein